MPPAREVCFVKYFQKGSTDTGADQMAAAHVRHGVAARSVFAHELAGIHDAVLIFIKRADLFHLLGARRRRNILVVDAQDTLVFKRGIRYAPLYHGIIFRSERARRDFGKGRAGAVVIPHHWDERYRPNEAGTDRLRIAFIGDPRSFPAGWELPGVERVFADWFARAPAFNAHLSVRPPGREMLYKPNQKVVTAAVCEAVLITTRDEAAVEHLGAGYPFYTEPGETDVVATIRRAEEQVGGPAWQRALALLAEVKQRTSLDRTTDLYVDYLQRFGELASPPPGATPMPLGAPAGW